MRDRICDVINYCVQALLLEKVKKRRWISMKFLHELPPMDDDLRMEFIVY